ncbi:hypothetical protein KW850_26045 [Bacillus sp. sid0103]|uniref:hypothetical protein n=1 Tax=Bacillus sp. sid0103 TaxID=2856337 RepID=UPI001C486741|nr:hypothetical protein [Bacillus sp. sid0103]
MERLFVEGHAAKLEKTQEIKEHTINRAKELAQSFSFIWANRRRIDLEICLFLRRSFFNELTSNLAFL